MFLYDFHLVSLILLLVARLFCVCVYDSAGWPASVGGLAPKATS